MPAGNVPRDLPLQLTTEEGKAMSLQAQDPFVELIIHHFLNTQDVSGPVLEPGNIK